jgi:hypothetical protein
MGRWRLPGPPKMAPGPRALTAAVAPDTSLGGSRGRLGLGPAGGA